MDYINIALSKGRLTNKTFELLSGLGIDFEDYSPESRKLIFMNEEKKVRIVSVKASDVPIYVEQGAADLGISGKDVLIETEAGVYELMDLGFGRCKFVVAALKGKIIESDKKLKVATKYPNTAKRYFLSKGIPIEIIKLNGSVELAPIMGLSDVIVDIVETGKTLKENGLDIVDEICQVSARLIINKASLKTKTQEINHIVKGLELLMGKKGVNMV